MSIEAIAEVHGTDAAQRVLDEARAQHADLGLDILTDLVIGIHAQDQLRATHVVVGDHPPEPRVMHCRFGDQPACSSHGHSCSCVVGRPQTHPTRSQGGYGASFDD